MVNISFGDISTEASHNISVNDSDNGVVVKKRIATPAFSIIFGKPGSQTDNSSSWHASTIRAFRIVPTSGEDAKCLPRSIYFSLYPNKLLSMARGIDNIPLSDIDKQMEDAQIQSLIQRQHARTHTHTHTHTHTNKIKTSAYAHVLR